MHLRTRPMRISGIAACLALAAASVLPSRPWAAPRGSSWRLEATVESDRAGLVQVYYDLGGGMSEELSVVRPIEPGAPRLLRFALPGGTIRKLRFDPLDRDCRMTISGVRIVDGFGRTAAAISPGQFEPFFQIESARVSGAELHVVTSPGGMDPQLFIRLAAPLKIPTTPVWAAVGEAFAAALAALFILERAWRSPALRLGERLRALWEGARARPALAVCAAALAGTLAANYPVVFAGRSLVSPNFGVPLLYGQNPWLPGAQSADIGRSNGSDVAAVLWHHLPLSTIERRALLHGELPLWNRFDSTGSPLLGQGQSCVGDPLQLLPVLANGAAWSWDLKLLLAKWAFAFGVGLCAWRSFRSLPAALATAASVSFIGFFVYRINHPAVFSLCYAPWILWCWMGLADSGGARPAVLWLAALVGANWVEMCSGTAKEAYLLLFAMNFTGACVVLACARPARARLGLLLGAAAAGGVFAMLSAPVWYIFLRALGVSFTCYNTPLAYQLQPGMLFGLFDEAFYRPFQESHWVVNPSANVFILLGLLWAGVRWRTVLANRAALGLLAAALAMLALAFGVIPPALVMRVPILGNIQHIDNTVSCALIVACAVLSAAGWAEAWGRLGTSEGRREAVAVLVLLVAVYAAYLGTAQTVMRSGYWQDTWGALVRLPAFIHGYGLSLLAASALLLWALHRGLARGRATEATLVLGLAALGALHWREGQHLATGFPEYVVVPPHRVNLMAPSPAVEAVRSRDGGPFRVVGFGNDMLPGWSIVYGLEGICGPDALVNTYYRDFMDTAGVPRVWDWRYMVEPDPLARVKPVMDVLNVRYYLGYHLDRRPDAALLKPVASEDMDVYESASAWPRAFFTDRVAVYRDLPQFFSWLRSGDGRPFAAIQQSDWAQLAPAPRVPGDIAGRRVVAASDYALGGNTTSFTVEATGPGFIVLTEAYEKDNFHLTVNGERARYLRVNHAFKGIYVGRAGTYRVSYEYYPRGLMMSLELSGAALAILALAVAGALFLPRRPAAPA